METEQLLTSLWAEDETAAIALEQLTLQGINSKETADILAQFFAMQIDAFPIQEYLRHVWLQEDYNQLGADNAEA